MEESSMWTRILRILGLALLLIIFPLLSWIYLSAGFSYQKDARAELQDYGRIAGFELQDPAGKIISHKMLANKLMLTAFYSSDEVQNERQVACLKRLHDQFDEREDVSFVVNALEQDKAALAAMMSKHEIDDPNQVFLLSGDDALILDQFRKVYKTPDIEKGRGDDHKYTMLTKSNIQAKDYPYFVLIDGSGMIRNYYDFRDEEQIKRVVEHLAILMPRVDGRKEAAKR